MNKLKKILTAIILTSVTASITASTQGAAITVDETGKGSIYGTPLLSSLQVEPLSGMTTLTYQLPFPGVPGDVQLIEVNKPQPDISDVIRFDGNFHMFFFSDQDGPPVDPADVGLPPPLAGWLTVVVPETGPEGNNGAYYNAGFFNPGGNTAGADYLFISDAAMPEPASLLILAVGSLLFKCRRDREFRGGAGWKCRDRERSI